MKRNSYKTNREEPPTLLGALDESHRACFVKPVLLIGRRISSLDLMAGAFDSLVGAGLYESGSLEPFNLIGRRRLPG